MNSTNPKDIAAKKRVRLDLLPGPAMVAMAQALQNGVDKGYGAFNWRTQPVQASNYLAAAERHIKAWQDGEEFAPDSKVHHLGHAAASLAILMDALACETLIDDRPPAGPTARLLTEAAALK
jgi:hypothetical protein